MSAHTFILNNANALAVNGDFEKAVTYYQSKADNVITSELQWLMDRCNTTHTVKTFTGKLPYAMVTKLKKLPSSYVVFGEDIVYNFVISFGCYVSNQNKVTFSYDTMTFNEHFGV